MPRKTAPATLADMLNTASLKKHAGSVYYGRGVEYYECDAVELRIFDENTITAHVQGTLNYNVTLRTRNHALDWSCSCPLGDEGEFCKHVVATGLAWLARTVATGRTGAQIDGDTDALIAIVKHDLRHAYDYLKVAEALAQAGRHDEALQWAEDGIKQFPNEYRGGLHDFAAAEYHRRKQHDKAIALRWAQFARSPGLSAYQTLKASADKNKSWSTWRDKAIAQMQAGFAQKPIANRVSWGYGSAAPLIEIHLWEGNPVPALAIARAHGCQQSQWLTLAQALEPVKPDEAIRIYQEQIEPIIKPANNDAYRRAGQLIARLGNLMTAAQRRPAFATWLAGVRLTHKAKRNFIGVLDGLAAKQRR